MKQKLRMSDRKTLKLIDSPIKRGLFDEEEKIWDEWINDRRLR